MKLRRFRVAGQVHRLTATAMIVALVGCSPHDDAGHEEDGVLGDTPTVSGTEVEQRPRAEPLPLPLQPETIMVEGMPEVIAVQAFSTSPDFPLGFSTVVPANMRVEQVGSGEGDVVRFEAAFGGVHRPEALLSLTVLPGDLTEAEAREQFASVAAVLGAGPQSGERFPWALQERRLIGDVSGFVALGRHQDRWYLMAMQHPPEYGDGMAPRVDLVLRRWRWMSDGSPLHPGEPRAGDGI